MTVVQIAYPLAPVSADAVGGAEQVLSALDEAVTAAGHHSVVVALEGSRCAGRLVEIERPRGPFDAEAQRITRDRVRAAAAELVAREHVDVVHLHGVDFDAVLPPPGPPALVTLHLPRAWYPDTALRPARPRTFFNCVSSAQHATFSGVDGLLPPIVNGVAVQRMRVRRRKARFAIALGRVSPEKGLHVAIDAARAAGVPLVIGGTVFPYPEHERYFAEEIRPRLGPGVRFAGPLNLARKRRLIAAARCVLVPSLAAESSSLVTMEALASGTPVVAFANGALTELVEDGRTGFLVRGVAEMAAAIARVGTLSAELCRRVAESRFTAAAMTARYLDVYRQLAAGGIAGAAPRVAT